MATIKLQLEPFPVPKHVALVLPAGKRQDGMTPRPTLPLSELPDEALEALIEEFATNVMATARPDKAME